MRKARSQFRTKIPYAISLSLPLAPLSWAVSGVPGEASPDVVSQLQAPPLENHEELLKPPSADSLAPPPVDLTRSRGPSWSKSIERLIDDGKFEAARARLKRETAVRGETHEVLHLEAKLLFKEKKFYESLKILQRCLALRQDDPDVYMLIASNGQLLDRADIAKPALRSAIQLAPSDVVPRFQLGGLYYTENHFHAAVRELREAVRLKPDFMPAHLLLGAALEELEDRDGALRSYRKAIDFTEHQKLRQEQPYLFLGRFLVRLNRHEEGLPYLQKAVDINPGSSEALYLIGKVMNAQGRHMEAIEALKKSAESHPQYPEPRYMLSRIYLRLGRQQEAEKEFRVFQELKREEKQKHNGRRRSVQNR